MISPLVWRIFYDPLLTRIQNCEQLGYKAEVKWPSNLGKNEFELIQKRQAVVAYADDTTWIAESKGQMEQIIRIAEEFYKINDIQINPSKSKLIVFNNKNLEEDSKIEIQGQEVKPTRKKEMVRFLGIWIGNKVQKAEQIARTKKIVGLYTTIIKKKKVSVSQVLYINNICLIPKIEYILQNIFLTRKECEAIQQTYITIAKSKVGLQRTTATHIILHSGILNLWQALSTKQLTSLMNRLNSNEGVGVLTQIRVRQGQLALGTWLDPWDQNSNTNEYEQLKNNLA